eukprot:scaffold2765_cov328-Prasinococcus_capsulatus_cf.AAC.3
MKHKDTPSSTKQKHTPTYAKKAAGPPPARNAPAAKDSGESKMVVQLDFLEPILPTNPLPENGFTALREAEGVNQAGEKSIAWFLSNGQIERLMMVGKYSSSNNQFYSAQQDSLNKDVPRIMYARSPALVRQFLNSIMQMWRPGVVITQASGGQFIANPRRSGQVKKGPTEVAPPAQKPQSAPPAQKPQPAPPAQKPQSAPPEAPDTAEDSGEEEVPVRNIFAEDKLVLPEKERRVRKKSVRFAGSPEKPVRPASVPKPASSPRPKQVAGSSKSNKSRAPQSSLVAVVTHTRPEASRSQQRAMSKEQARESAQPAPPANPVER